MKLRRIPCATALQRELRAKAYAAHVRTLDTGRAYYNGSQAWCGTYCGGEGLRDLLRRNLQADSQERTVVTMKTIQNTKVVDDYGTVIAGNGESYWIEVQPGDVATLWDKVSRATTLNGHRSEGAKRLAYKYGTGLARNDGNGDTALHAAMVDDASHGLGSAFFYWDEENGTWRRVALAEL